MTQPLTAAPGEEEGGGAGGEDVTKWFWKERNVVGAGGFGGEGLMRVLCGAVEEAGALITALRPVRT